MTCRAWEALLQEHFDDADDGRLEQHFHSCPECSVEQFSVRRLREGIMLLTPIPPPANLAEQIVGQLLTEARQRRRLQLRRRFAKAGILAAAAALLLVAGVRLFQPMSRNDPTSSPGVSNAANVEPPAQGLRESVAEASNAVASLTSRAASETMDQTASLFPLLPSPTLEPLTAGPAPIEPLREASASVSARLAPLTNSAPRGRSVSSRSAHGAYGEPHNDW